MDFSKLELRVYDLLGILVPGVLAICEGWVFLRGWAAFASSASQLSGADLILLAFFAYATGNLVQELGDWLVMAWKGDRFFLRPRDDFWNRAEANHTKAVIRKELGKDLSADEAFDYCLTKLEGRFHKRNVFVAISGLSRSLAVLSVLAVIPAARSTWRHNVLNCYDFAALGAFVAFAVFLAYLSWRRMLRFLDLSQTTVFRAYLATVSEPDK